MVTVKIKKIIIRLYIKILEYFYLPYFFYKIIFTRKSNFMIKPLRGYFDSSNDRPRYEAMEKCLNKQIDNYLLNCEKTSRPPFVFLEVGSYIGTSFIFFYKILESRLKNNYLMISVDPFENTVPAGEKEWGVKFMGSSVNKIYFYFLYNLSRQSNYKNFIHIRRKSIEAVNIVRKLGPLDFAYIDGSHYYKRVYDDVENYFKLLVNEQDYKGIISGDDLELTCEDIINLDPNINNVSDFEDFINKFSNTIDQTLHMQQRFHPGVTKALHFFTKKNKLNVKTSNGFWNL